MTKMIPLTGPFTFSADTSFPPAPATRAVVDSDRPETETVSVWAGYVMARLWHGGKLNKVESASFVYHGDDLRESLRHLQHEGHIVALRGTDFYVWQELDNVVGTATFQTRFTTDCPNPDCADDWFGEVSVIFTAVGE